MHLQSGGQVKWFEGSNIKSEQKFKTVENLDWKPTVLVSNDYIKAKNEKVQEAFDNRIIKLTFKYKLKPEEINEIIINEIKEEEASIMIHCNEIYFNHILDKKKTRMNYKRMCLLINYDSNINN